MRAFETNSNGCGCQALTIMYPCSSWALRAESMLFASSWNHTRKFFSSLMEEARRCAFELTGLVGEKNKVISLWPLARES